MNQEDKTGIEKTSPKSERKYTNIQFRMYKENREEYDSILKKINRGLNRNQLVKLILDEVLFDKNHGILLQIKNIKQNHEKEKK